MEKEKEENIWRRKKSCGGDEKWRKKRREIFGEWKCHHSGNDNQTRRVIWIQFWLTIQNKVHCACSYIAIRSRYFIQKQKNQEGFLYPIIFQTTYRLSQKKFLIKIKMSTGSPFLIISNRNRVWRQQEVYNSSFCFLSGTFSGHPVQDALSCWQSAARAAEECQYLKQLLEDLLTIFFNGTK